MDPGKPVAVAITVNAVGGEALGNGNLNVYPADGTPGGATVLFQSGANSGNSTILSLCNDGSCDGQFTVLAKNSGVPVSAIVTGYFYPPSRQVTVATTGGDYKLIQDAIDDSDSWCPGPFAVNRCVVKVAPGFYFEDNIAMKSFISVDGAGLGNTTVYSAQPSGAIFEFFGVSNATLSNLLIVADGESAVDVTAIEIDTTQAGTPNVVRLENIAAFANNGNTNATAISIFDAGGVQVTGDSTTEGRVFLDYSFFIAGQIANPDLGGGQVSLGMVVDSPNFKITNSEFTGVDVGLVLGDGGSGLSVNGAIANSTFSGGFADVYVPGSTLTVRHSHMENNAVVGDDFTNITCLFVSGGQNMLDSSCRGDVLDPNGP